MSAFEPQQLGPFKLRIESQMRFDLTPIPQEGAGMFNRVVRGAWCVLPTTCCVAGAYDDTTGPQRRRVVVQARVDMPQIHSMKYRLIQRPSFCQSTLHTILPSLICNTLPHRIRLQLVEAVPPASINVSVFQQRAPRKLVTTSGPYSDGVAGVATPQTMLQPGVYHVVPSTYNPGLLRVFKLIFYSSRSIKISALTRS